MKNDDYKTKHYTEESWRKAHDGAPLPLEAYGQYEKAKEHNKEAKQDRELNKQKSKSFFNDIYDKSKDIKFLNESDLNMESYRMLPKISTNLKDEFGSRNALAVYPVLCDRADFEDPDKYVQISRENIGKLAGLSAPTVDKGIKVLLEQSFDLHSELFLYRQWTNDPMRQQYEYLPTFYRNGSDFDPNDEFNEGAFFQFCGCIIRNGIWADLNPRAQALYYAMRSKSYFHPKAYKHDEGILIKPRVKDPEHKKAFRQRKWDICEISHSDLAKMIGTQTQNVSKVMKELISHGLVEKEPVTQPIYKVYLTPKSFVKHDYKA